jgi:hypothetical protein
METRWQLEDAKSTGQSPRNVEDLQYRSIASPPVTLSSFGLYPSLCLCQASFFAHACVASFPVHRYISAEPI